MRVGQKLSKGNVPQSLGGETPSRGATDDGGLLTVRSAIILGTSLVLAVCAGGLTYLAAVQPAMAVLAGAILAGGLAFGGAIRLLNTIIR